MKKQLISGMASMAIIMNTIGFNLTANAKVIEPEIVKTETWTTSYYIDDDMETLYPYIDCQADIYNDGTVKVSFWNTHEWDGFATVRHTVTIVGGGFFGIRDSFDNIELKYSSSSRYNLKNKGSTYPYKLSYYQPPYEYVNDIDWSMWHETYLEYKQDWNNKVSDLSIYEFQYSGYLPNLPVDTIWQITFIPTKDPISTYNFRIFEHEFTVTPEILSGNIVAKPVITDTEKRIQELEKENAELKKQNENLLNILNSQGNKAYGDMNNDGFVDGRDASLLLTYYAKTSVGYTGTLDDFIQEQDKVEN
jgi:hypothetical protein